MLGRRGPLKGTYLCRSLRKKGSSLPLAGRKIRWKDEDYNDEARHATFIIYNDEARHATFIIYNDEGCVSGFVIETFIFHPTRDDDAEKMMISYVSHPGSVWRERGGKARP